VARELHDHYFQMAKRQGYLSRAAYKLLEIDERKSVLKHANRVLDCGAAPGSWLQVASACVGDQGTVVGIDLQAIAFQAANVRIITADLLQTPASALLAPLGKGHRFDVILSDMAPSTTGDRTIDHHQSMRLCDSVLQLCPDLLCQGGRLVIKVFEGEAYPELLGRTKAMFDVAKGFKPKASRSVSREMYVVAAGYKQTAPAADVPEPPLPRKPDPPPGWSGRP
jgi:23S rRNA (uridine2552-2'-O)-methyltransferase